MSAQPGDTTLPRVDYLDSIRGLAAIQVLLLHAFAAFVPGLVVSVPNAPAWMSYVHLSPLFFLYDGYSAVYIFFGLSGYVLSGSFARQLDRPIAIVGARILRLGIPALAATVFAAAMLWTFGRPGAIAGGLTLSDWFSHHWDPDLSIGSILRDGIANALFLGYRGFSTPALFDPWQMSIENSFAAPLWTLSVEFYGSLIVLALCLIARRSERLWALAIFAGIIFSVRGAYICFIAGHVMATIYASARPDAARRPLLALCAILTGLFLCVSAEVWQPEWIKSFCSNPILSILPPQHAPLQQKTFGAIFILYGLLNLPAARSWLSSPRLVRWSGLSFPIYLVHWPILFGPSAVIFLSMQSAVGVEAARWAAVVVTIMLSVLAACAFQPIDRAALWLAKVSRQRGLFGRSKELQPDGPATINRPAIAK